MDDTQILNRRLFLLDFVVQCILFVINIVFLCCLILDLVTQYIEIGDFFPYAYMQAFICFYQFLSITLSRFFFSFDNMSIHRKVHFFVSLWVIVIFALMFMTSYIRVINVKEDLYSGTFFLFLSFFLVVFNLFIVPQILMYYYFWITWNEYKGQNA